MPGLNISECYCTNSRRAAGALTEFYDKELKPADVTTPQYCMLINLRRLGSANITRWAEAVGIERSTMVRNVRPLEARGLIEQTEGRGKTYTLSDKGNETVDKALILWEGAQKKIESYLGKEDADALIRVTRRFQNLSE
ncbi:MAG: MarR family winged helix-turn-helix transcriptional regulator [Anaerovoracaceae bacterium]|jgi:DNA-binding MarR family transcriptional regulator